MGDSPFGLASFGAVQDSGGRLPAPPCPYRPGRPDDQPDHRRGRTDEAPSRRTKPDEAPSRRTKPDECRQ